MFSMEEASKAGYITFKLSSFNPRQGEATKAVAVFLQAGQQQRALEVVANHSVPLTDDLAEKLTPAKTSDNAAERSAALRSIAKAAKAQGLFHLACKKYTQGGDKVKGMKCLLKTGDTEKIVFFANVSRVPDLYVMAANHLQTSDWYNNAELAKTIVQLYTKVMRRGLMCCLTAALWYAVVSWDCQRVSLPCTWPYLIPELTLHVGLPPYCSDVCSWPRKFALQRPAEECEQCRLSSPTLDRDGLVYRGSPLCYAAVLIPMYGDG